MRHFEFHAISCGPNVAVRFVRNGASLGADRPSGVEWRDEALSLSRVIRQVIISRCHGASTRDSPSRLFTRKTVATLVCACVCVWQTQIHNMPRI